ncbi:MAG TPA: tetratricopeptide repeat protein [Stellaceae bacterium]|nr:tetratricopeptide repeat protein [Stellaceae bacterium]
MMQFRDAHDNLVTAASPEAVAALDATVTAYLGFRADTGDRLKAAVAADPDLPLAHVLRGCFMLLFGRRAMVPRAQAALDAAQAAAARRQLTAREEAHVAALAAWVAGDLAGATRGWEELAAEHPRDILALKLGQYGCFYMGESARMRGVIERGLAHWSAAIPDYAFLLGCHAFGLEETGDYLAAERAGRAAVENNPADIWAAHAVAHVCEMTGRAKDGAEWVGGLAANWRECNNFAYHALWHRCLFLIELGETERALELYDRDVRAESSDDLLDIANAVSLLWRLESEGVDVGDRWQELAERSEAHIGDHLLTFGDVHYVMALAAAGKDEAVERMLQSLENFAATSPESEAAVAREPGLALARAAVAHRRGDWAGALEGLLPVRERVCRIGGSHAQRDLFEEMLIDAALRGGRASEAKALLDRRLELRPGNAWGRRRLQGLAG